MLAVQSIVAGALAKISADNGFSEPVVVTVKSLEQVTEKKYRCQFSDGAQTIRGVLASQVTDLIVDGTLKEGSAVRLNNYVLNKINNEPTIMVTELEVVTGAAVKAEPSDVDMKGATTPNQKKTPSINKENSRPTPGPTPSPSEEPSAKAAKTPSHPTPGSASARKLIATPPTERKTFHKIGALNPYSEHWCIKAKLERKGMLRSINSKNGPSSLMTIELVDDQGTQIQGTFWRQSAEKYHETLVEGKVYVIAKFSVKPANKQYSGVKNDYEINFSDSTEVIEAPASDQDAAVKMTAAVEVVPIDCLLKHLTRKAPVDVMGVIVSISPLGTVKRKSDGEELQKREVTLADQSGKSVVLTLWGDNANSPKLDSAEGSVMQVTACRVTDFNGCSLSTISKSSMSIDPDTPECQDLKTWYQGQTGKTFASVGQDAPNGRASGGERRDQIQFLKDVLPESGAMLPDPDAKPAYHQVMAHVASINTDQAMYYLANPDTGRKVVEQEGRYYSDFDAKYVDRAEHRYVLSFKGMDPTGECWLNMFNEQAELLLGIKADELAALKSSEPERFEARLKKAQWGEWAMTVSSKTREYQGERKMRHTVTAVRPINYISDGMKMAEIIAKY